VALFNRGEFFECHEVLEELWKAERRPIRDLFQGIIQIAVGLHHLKRGNRRGALFGLNHGAVRVARFGPSCFGLDIRHLLDDVQVVLAQIETGPEADVGKLNSLVAPRIRVARGSGTESGQLDNAPGSDSQNKAEGDPDAP
jgi:predicted metal-dependent hydrolase